MPPTPDDVEAAAGRLRRLAAGESVSPDRSDYPHALASRADDQTLADAWLAANPADDAEPIDAAWLETVGGRLNYLRQREWLYGADGHHLSVIRGAPPGWSCDVVSTDSAVELPPITTRGQLRRLLAALGVPAASPANPTPTPKE